MKIEDLKEGKDVYLYSSRTNSYRLCRVAKLMKRNVSLYVYDVKCKVSYSYKDIDADDEMVLTKEEGDEKIKIKESLSKINFLLKKPFSSIELNEIFEFTKSIKKRSKNEN